MQYSKELKLFCQQYNLEFPLISINYDMYEYYTCSLLWYDTIYIVGEPLKNKEHSIQSCILRASDWVKKSEENFISLINLDKMKFPYKKI